MADFNDVDMSLVDAAELFPNLESLREISANYLTENQIAAIRRHWDEERIPARGIGFLEPHHAHAPSARPKTADGVCEAVAGDAARI